MKVVLPEPVDTKDQQEVTIKGYWRLDIPAMPMQTTATGMAADIARLVNDPAACCLSWFSLNRYSFTRSDPRLRLETLMYDVCGKMPLSLGGSSL